MKLFDNEFKIKWEIINKWINREILNVWRRLVLYAIVELRCKEANPGHRSVHAVESKGQRKID